MEDPVVFHRRGFVSPDRADARLAERYLTTGQDKLARPVVDRRRRSKCVGRLAVVRSYGEPDAVESRLAMLNLRIRVTGSEAASSILTICRDLAFGLPPPVLWPDLQSY